MQAKTNGALQREDIAALLTYEPLTGEVRWTGSSQRAGQLAGSPDERGRIRVVVIGVRFKLHRLCWLLGTGQWPQGVIDHINGNPADNRLANLRDVPAALNNQNRRGPTRRSQTQRAGVVRGGAGFRVCMSFQGKPLTVYGFESEDAASAAHLQLKRLLHEGNTL